MRRNAGKAGAGRGAHGISCRPAARGCRARCGSGPRITPQAPSRTGIFR